MKLVGSAPWEFWSSRTMEHRGRVFNLSQDSQRLRITEVLLGEEVQCVSVTTGVDSKTDDDRCIVCCSFGEQILVMSGKQEEDASAVLVGIDEGPLSKASVHVTELTVEGDKVWDTFPYLCAVSENRALLYFYDRNSMWYCDIKGTTLAMRKLTTEMPGDQGFGVVPLRLPDGRLFVAGAAWPESTDIVLITPNEEPTFEKVGEMPGVPRSGPSTILIGSRLVLSFGGSVRREYTDEFWIYDIKTHKVSPMAQGEEWYGDNVWSTLVIHDDKLYSIGGYVASSIYSCPLRRFARLIRLVSVRFAFYNALGIPVRPKMMSQLTATQDYILTWL